MNQNDNNEPLGWVKFLTPKDDWYYIDSEERNRYYENYEKITSKVFEKGAKLIGTYKCRGQSPWFRFEVWEFPLLAILIDFSNALEDIGHYKYFEEENVFGRKYLRNTDPENWLI